MLKQWTNSRKKYHYPNPLDRITEASIRGLQRERANRNFILGGNIIAAFVGGEAVKKLVMENPAISERVKGLSAKAAAGIIFSALITSYFTNYQKSKNKIKKCTIHIGSVLGEEAKRSTKLMGFLTQHKYVLIDGEGELLGTSTGRVLGIGRVRLECRKILSGEYGRMARGQNP